MLEMVSQYCKNKVDCRRVQVLRYFGERFPEAECHRTCDRCASGVGYESRDVSEYARAALQIVGLVHQKTLIFCIEIFHGSGTKEHTDAVSERTKWYGFGRNWSWGDCERLFHHLVGDGVIVEDIVRNDAGFYVSNFKVSFSFIFPFPFPCEGERKITDRSCNSWIVTSRNQYYGLGQSFPCLSPKLRQNH
jgi:bloom syndrome protein